MTEEIDSRVRLLHLLADTPGVITCFAPGEERPLAHHKSDRKPAEVYAGAELSPYFCNLRMPDNKGDKQGTLTAEAVDLMGMMFFRELFADGTEFHAVAVIPNAGDPILAAMRDRAKGQVVMHAVSFRKEDGPGGRKFFRIDQNDETVVKAVIDDVLTLADVKFRFISAIGENGGVKPVLYILIDRHEGGREIMEALGYRVVTVFTIEEVLATCFVLGKATQEQVERVAAYAARRRDLVTKNMDAILADLRGSAL